MAFRGALKSNDIVEKRSECFFLSFSLSVSVAIAEERERRGHGDQPSGVNVYSQDGEDDKQTRLMTFCPGLLLSRCEQTVEDNTEEMNRSSDDEHRRPFFPTLEKHEGH